MDWVYMKHAETNGVTRVPAKTVAAHEKRGWIVTDPPSEEVFVPRTAAPSEGQWVDMRHPSGGVQRIPNKPSALAEARRNGWTADVKPAPEQKLERTKTPAAGQDKKNKE